MKAGHEIRGLTGLALAALLLQGCAMAPGMRMADTAPAEATAWSAWQPRGPAIEPTRIDAALIQQLAGADQARAAQLAVDAPRGHYRVGPGDVLSITVWEHPELTIPAGEARPTEAAGQLIGEDGTLFYPYVGNVNVAGLTLAEVRALLTQRLGRYIENAQLDVRVAAYRSQKVYVGGEVAQPGAQPLADLPLTVADAIARAGGLSADADRAVVTLTRDGHAHTLDLRAFYERGDARHNPVLQHGDVLSVGDRHQRKVFLMGEVNRPAALPMAAARMSLAQALGEVGGVNPISADPGRIYVIRGTDPTRPQVFHLDARSADALALAEGFELQPRDTVFVDAAGVSRWNRVISQLLPSAQLLKSTTDIRQ